MLVAPVRNYSLSESRHAPVPEPKPHRKPAAERKAKAKARLFALGALLIVFVLGLSITAEAALLGFKGYQLDRLKKEVADIKVQSEKLGLELNKMQSLDRIEAIAVSQLGMQKPSITDWELLPEKASQLNLAAELPAPGTTSVSKHAGSSRWNRWAAALSKLMGLARVYASEL